MKNNAVISICSKQNNDEGIEVVTPGRFYQEDGIYYAVYEETEASGMEGTTTKLEIKEYGFSLIREGTISTVMNFKRNHQEDILYSTPHGGLSLKLRTKHIDVERNDNEVKLYVEYDMLIKGQEPLNTILNANIKLK